MLLAFFLLASAVWPPKMANQIDVGIDKRAICLGLRTYARAMIGKFPVVARAYGLRPINTGIDSFPPN